MNKIITIARKEWMALFQSSMGYIVLTITLLVFHFFFYLIIEQNQEASLRDVFRIMEFLFVFLIPLLTMKTLSEEKSMGTMEFLMTTPTTNGQIILGKYLGVVAFFTVLIAMTGVYYVILEFFASPDRASIGVGYFGIWLEGLLFVAIGVLASALTRYQIIAALVAYLILFVLYFIPAAIPYTSGSMETVANYIAVSNHSVNFFSGLITIQDLAYFITGISFCLLLSRLNLRSQN